MRKATVKTTGQTHHIVGLRKDGTVILFDFSRQQYIGAFKPEQVEIQK